MDEHRLGNRIRAFRKLKGYTQQEFAEKLGISVTLLGMVERGVKDPPERLLEQIGQLLGVPVKELKEMKLDHREG